MIQNICKNHYKNHDRNNSNKKKEDINQKQNKSWIKKTEQRFGILSKRVGIQLPSKLTKKMKYIDYLHIYIIIVKIRLVT